MGVKTASFELFTQPLSTQNGPNPQSKDFKHSNDVMIVMMMIIRTLLEISGTQIISFDEK